MDLDEISCEQALLDIDIANARILDLSLRIERASVELMGLRAEVSELNRAAEAEAASLKSEIRGVSTNVYNQYVGLILKKFKPEQKKRLLIANIDEVCGRQVTGNGQVPKHSVTSREFRSLTISGWAIPQNFAGYFSSIEIVLRGQGTPLRLNVSATPREDVARHFSNPSIERAGFNVSFLMSLVKKGQYSVELHGQTDAGATAMAEILVLDVH